jgi:hypothetical protein
MNTRTTLSVLLVLILTTVVATTQTSSATASNGPEAFGDGQFRFNNELVHFSFHAKANKNGHASGRAQYDNLTTQTTVLVRINCLSASVFTASMGGIVLHSNDPDFPKGARVLFAASDDSLVLPGGVDDITPLFVNPFLDLDCNDTQPLTILPVENGDVRIEL